MLLKLGGFQYDTLLDLNMRCYHIILRNNANNLCKMIIPWVEYRYIHLPVVVANSPDILQQIMNDLFHGFEFIRAYIDDLLVFTKYTGHIMYRNCK